MKFEDFLEEWHSPEEVVLVHTSGSTGRPKPMWVEKQKMLNSARITCDFLDLKSGDNALLCMPLDYIAGKMMVVRALQRGMNIISVEPSNHPLADLVDNEEVSSLSEDDYLIHLAAMVPSQVYCSLQVPEEKALLKKIRHLIIGGGAISPSLDAELKALFSPEESENHYIWSTYGMTETLSHIALRRLNGTEANEWYEPFDNVHVSLDADDCLMIDAPLVHEGILKTNDICELDGQRFRVIGRKDNVICSGGIKLQIEQIEESLLPLLQPYTHDTQSFCITKCADEKFGEVVVLLIYKGISISEDELQHIFSQLPNYFKPRKVLFVDAIPTTQTGKIDRKLAQTLVN